jgi:hypothetical protein
MLTLNGSKPVSFRSSQQNGLAGKVALVVCDREEAVRALVVGLAGKGVDIALACVAEPARNLLKDDVEAQGRRFLPIRGRINSEDVVKQVTRMLGKLDLFIDCSSPAEVTKEKAGGRDYKNGGPAGSANLELFANSILTRAALNALNG